MGRPPRVCSQYNFNIAQRIVKLRAAAGFDQATFANKMGISQSQWSRFESGKVTINIDHLFQIGKILKFTTAFLILGCEP